jgi:hypothetical protein
MSRQPHDPQRMPPPLERLGAQFRELEDADERARLRSAPRRWRPISIPAGGAALVVLVIVFVVLAGGPARALNVINRAPAAAAASESVRFRSVISISQPSQQLASFRQFGEIDFARRDYATTLQIGRHGGSIEQRRVDGILYVALLLRERGPRTPIRWLAIPLAHEASTTFASAPESEQFTNPLVLLDELAGTRAPVTVLGREDLHGVPTTRYRLQTNLAALLSASPHAAILPASYRTVAVTLTVWLDRQGRPRQVEETIVGPSSTGRASIVTITDFSGYAEPVAIRAPAKVALSTNRTLAAPNPLAASPTRLFERQLFAHH